MTPPKQQKIEEVLVGTIEWWMKDELLMPRRLMRLVRQFNQESQLSVGVGTAGDEMVKSGHSICGIYFYASTTSGVGKDDATSSRRCQSYGVGVLLG